MLGEDNVCYYIDKNTILQAFLNFVQINVLVYFNKTVTNRIYILIKVLYIILYDNKA